MSTPVGAPPSDSRSLPARFALSAAASSGVHLPAGAETRWIAGRAAAHRFAIEQIPFAALRGWSFAPETGNLVHDSGRFFSVEGLRLRAAGPDGTTHQPIIRQPEVGILGILVKEFDGVLHFLMQAKMEPGNPNPVMLSPTVQATRSNYTRVHRGAPVRYLEHFAGPGRGRVIADVLQSEHGDWFHGKRNRNMVVEAIGPVERHEDFCWLTLGQLDALLTLDNVVNMDARTVLSCLPRIGGAPDGDAVLPTAELLSWFTGERADRDPQAELVPLGGLPGWRRDDHTIHREDGAAFKVVAVDVRAAAREVASWTQPLIEPVGRGLSAFLVRDFGGVRHVLVQALAEPGFRDAVELGPTVQRMSAADPPYGDQVFLASVPPPGSQRALFEAVHAEEGGRFRNAESRYVIAEAGAAVPDDPPPGFAWATPAQLAGLLRHGHYLNVQARTLVACMNTLY